MADPEPVIDITERLRELTASAPVASEAELAAYEARKAVEARAERLRWSGIDEHLPRDVRRRVVRDDLDATDALDAVRRWMAYQAGDRPKGPRHVLVLCGTVGRGKTVAAADLLATYGGRCVQESELCRLSLASFGDEAAEYQRVLRTGLLVVDEVGTFGDAKRSASTVHEVVDRRYRQRTLMLSNLSRTALAEHLDDRTRDRLRGHGFIVELTGESMR